MSDNKIQVSVEEVKKLKNRLNEINSLPLKDIEWTEDGKVIDISPDSVKDWNTIGLNNVEYIMSDFYKCGSIEDLLG